MRATHIVPLATQAIIILREPEKLTGHCQYVFPSICTSHGPMPNNTVLGGLRRLGYSKDEMTGHGFRSMASTLLSDFAATARDIPLQQSLIYAP
jgi:integrase